MRASITTDMFNYSFMPGMAEKLGLFREYGFEYLHWCDDWANDKLYTRDEMNQYKSLIEDANLQCLDVHGTATHNIRIDTGDQQAHKTYVKLLKNRVEFCHAVGGDAIVFHPPENLAPDLEKRLKRSHQAIKEVKSMCLDLGVRLAVENCNKADERILQEYFDTYSPELMGYCFDSGHANKHNNLEKVMNFKERLIVTHLHDNKGEADDHQYPGWGTIDWVHVKNWLQGYDKPLNFEVTHYEHHFDGSMREFMALTSEAARNLL